MLWEVASGLERVAKGIAKSTNYLGQSGGAKSLCMHSFASYGNKGRNALSNTSAMRMKPRSVG